MESRIAYEMIIGYVLLFLFVSIVSFWCGREWERSYQEEQKKQQPIWKIPRKWE